MGQIPWDSTTRINGSRRWGQVLLSELSQKKKRIKCQLMSFFPSQVFVCLLALAATLATANAGLLELLKGKVGVGGGYGGGGWSSGGSYGGGYGGQSGWWKTK